jgi:hypothetical protein
MYTLYPVAVPALFPVVEELFHVRVTCESAATAPGLATVAVAASHVGAAGGLVTVRVALLAVAVRIDEPNIEATRRAPAPTVVTNFLANFAVSVELDIYFSSLVVDHSTKLCTYVNAQISESPRPVLLT